VTSPGSMSPARTAWRLWLCMALMSPGACGRDGPPRLILGTTHTLEDSGLLDVLVREYQKDHGADRRLSVIVAGSGEVLAMARRGDVDLVLSHSPDAEMALIEDGAAVSRQNVMHNDFVLLGPPSDPAGAAAAVTPAAAFGRIAAAAQPFVSRGDDSGTHAMEKAVWRDAQLSPSWSGYMEAGTGMADALRLASQRAAYILADRATYEVLRAGLALEIMHESDMLLNQYSVLIPASAQDTAGARQLAAWLLGERAQQLIAAYRAPGGDAQLFVPDGSR
jgi:tungstate transport system substrate-binding protein